MMVTQSGRIRTIRKPSPDAARPTRPWLSANVMKQLPAFVES